MPAVARRVDPPVSIAANDYIVQRSSMGHDATLIISEMRARMWGLVFQSLIARNDPNMLVRDKRGNGERNHDTNRRERAAPFLLTFLPSGLD